MKVIILGAGQVGASVAEGLVSEENDITVVDSDGARLMRLQDKIMKEDTVLRRPRVVGGNGELLRVGRA